MQFFFLPLLIFVIVAVPETGSTEDFLYGNFPPGFKWGFSSSAYQIEGAWAEDGKGLSIWDNFTHTNPSPIYDHSNGDIACDSYHKFEEDVQLLKNAGANTYRFSLSWSRILPKGTLEIVNQKGIDYYNRLIDLLISNEIEPMITLYHWDLPQHLQDITGGWPNESIIENFVLYAELAFSKFGDRVKTWFTFNEPWVDCLMGYGEGIFPPGIKEISELPYKCSHNIIKAHAEAYHLYDDKFRSKFHGRVGIVLDSGWFEPASKSPQDIEAAERARQFKHGLFGSPLFFGKYPDVVRKYVDERSKNEGRNSSRLPQFDDAWSKFIKGTVDILGLNHYTSEMVSAKIREGPPSWFTDQNLTTFYDESWPHSASTWLRVYPPGLRRILNWIKETYGNNVEVLVTENGYSDPGSADWNDDKRISYFKGYTNNLLKAVTIDGCNVTGYLAWSLLDNFEWARGFSERFGVHWVDFEDPNRKRVPKKSASFLKGLFTKNGFENEKKEL